MKTVCADTFFFIAQLNPDDRAHAKTLAFARTYQGRMLTTDWVIVELADAFARPPNRATFVALYQKLQGIKELVVVPAERALLHEGFQFYAARPDKDWSLTDCMSFVVRHREGITEALTGDHHFEQDGRPPRIDFLPRPDRDGPSPDDGRGDAARRLADDPHRPTTAKPSSPGLQPGPPPSGD
jgi:predicted nucleic acid-binding protein